MTITIFGATGMVGKHLVKQALLMGHTVRAFGRNVFTSNFAEDKKLHLIQGALFDAQEVLKAVRGSDAVLSALGGALDGSDKTRSLGIKNIVAQMEKANVKRLVAVGGLGVLSAPDETFIMDAETYPPEFIPVALEHLKAYNTLQASRLDWTFVGAPDIVDADVTGSFHTTADYPPTLNHHKIRAGDLAMFMLNELDKNEYIKKRVGISN